MHSKHEIIVRPYQEADASFLAKIYFDTIHIINSNDYTQDQLEAWAPISSLDPSKWIPKWRNVPPIVAVMNDRIVGFAELEATGHIDCFYCHHDYQGKGVGTALMQAIEERALANNTTRLFAEVSITARPFFEARGFNVEKEQSVMVRGVALTNFVMEKGIS